MTVTTAVPIVQLILDTATAVLPDANDPELGVEVLDSISDRQGFAERSLTVGGAWDPDAEAWTSDQTVTTTVETRGAGRTVTETTTVSCIAFCGSGGLDYRAQREQVQQSLMALDAALRAVHDLGGIAVQVQIDSQQWAYVQDGQGGGVMCLFNVTALALP